ncbi:MAG: DegV family EDD domain-containing protein [Anaerolineae bacterium]|nr:DegV family EDD domain-containing protein [Anaerolineae bacterium]
MANARIVTDVTALLEPEQVDQLQITALPLNIKFGKETFRISSRQTWDSFFEHMAGRPAQKTEISIPPDAFQQAFSQLNRETEEILVIPSSGMLSSVYSQAQSAARAFLGRCRIQVMDSMAVSWGLGFLVQAAADAAADGQSLDTVVRLVRGMLPHIYVIFSAERLDYLERGGRIGPAQALLGTILHIKPMLLVEDGELVPVEKVRTQEMALEKLADFVAEFAAIQQVVILRSPLAGEHSPQVAELREHLSLALPNQVVPVVEYDPILACHLGPEALGVVVYEGI